MTFGGRDGPGPMRRLPGEDEALWRVGRRPRPFEHRSAEERLRVAWEGTWAEPPAHGRLRRKIYEFIGDHRALAPGRGFFVIGRSGVGTSAFMRRVARDYRQSHAGRIALADMPHTVEYRDLLVELRRAVGHTYCGREPAHEQEWKLLQEFGRSDVVAVVIDSMEHLLHVSSARRKLMIDLLLHVAATARIHLILAVPLKLFEEADLALNGSVRLTDEMPAYIREARRFQEVRLGPFRIDHEYVDLLDAWERAMPLLEASDLAQRETALHLYALCDGSHGRLASILRRAAAEAIGSGRERITIGLLDGMGFGPPASFSGFRF